MGVLRFVRFSMRNDDKRANAPPPPTLWWRCHKIRVCLLLKNKKIINRFKDNSLLKSKHSSLVL